MTNIVQEWDLNPICQSKFHWPPVDTERPDDDFLTKAKQVIRKTCVCVVQDSVLM